MGTVVLEAERWLELRRFRALRDAGATISEIARETGLNWRTVRKYLEDGGPAAAPRPSRRNQVIAAYAPVIDAWLRAELLLKGTVIHERLFTQALTAHRDLGETRPAALAQISLGQVLVARGTPDQAIEPLSQATATLTKHALRFPLWHGHLRCGHSAVSEGL